MHKNWSDLRLSGYRGNDLDIVACRLLTPGKVVDMTLDPAETWEVAITDMNDPHRLAQARDALTVTCLIVAPLLLQVM